MQQAAVVLKIQWLMMFCLMSDGMPHPLVYMGKMCYIIYCNNCTIILTCRMIK